MAIDFLMGAVPVVGDAFDVFWKANQRNVALLRRHVSSSPTERRRATWGDRVFVVVVVIALLLILMACIAVALATIQWIGHFLPRSTG